MNPPKISIIIPVYNVEKYIHRCMDSVLAQTFVDFECILVDDGTPDNSGKICDEYAEKDARVKVIHKQKNEGLPQARKTGFEQSTGSYILNVDSDDYIENNMIEKMYYKISNENSDMVYCNFFYHNKFNEIENNTPINYKDNFIDNVKIFIFNMPRQGYIWNKLIKWDIYQNLIFSDSSYLEDIYLTTQILFYSKKINYIDESLYHYIYNQVSIIHNKKNKKKKYIEMSNNIENVINFLKIKHNNNLESFYPELNSLYKWLNDENPSKLKNIIKGVLRDILPLSIQRIIKKLSVKKI